MATMFSTVIRNVSLFYSVGGKREGGLPDGKRAAYGHSQHHFQMRSRPLRWEFYGRGIRSGPSAASLSRQNAEA